LGEWVARQVLADRSCASFNLNSELDIEEIKAITL